MVNAVERVRERLRRVVGALELAGVPYAVCGGNAVAAWVATIDAGAVRNTQDVDILLRRADLDAARAALERVGFIYRHSSGIDMFLDGPDAGARDAVRVVFADERVREGYIVPAPSVDETARPAGFGVLSLEALVRMKLTSCRDKDRTHVRDMLEVGPIDASWAGRLPGELGARLQALIETPDG
jgi:hypothetical protein